MSVAFYAFVVAPMRPVAADDAADAQWVNVSTLSRSRVAFDHNQIIALAVERLREQLHDAQAHARLDLVPQRFTLSELQHVHEAVLGHQLDKRNFRAKLLQRNFVEPVAAAQRTGRHRPAQLYRWTEAAAPPPAIKQPHRRSRSKKSAQNGKR